ncbi:CK1/WORM6 protein kinase [Aphelenchoides avenae]|nr:CK1/WORM6 protein kinase [Aphelenchus avenae]
MTSTDTNDQERLPNLEETVQSDTNKKYKLVAALGEGGYGCVFECTDEQRRRWALKAEKYSKSMLRVEIHVLKATRYRQCKHFCEVVDYGRVPNEYLFVVMTLLGPDLAKLRNLQPDRHFSLSTAPGNFAVGTKDNCSNRTVFMFDFGLARKYVDKNFQVLPPRPDPGWRGTSRYGSLRAHLRQDLGRKDDCESWMYMLVEITKGSLPWRLAVDRAKVHEAKLHARGPEGRKEFLHDPCPKQYSRIVDMIDDLTFEAAPPHELIVNILMEVCAENGIRMSDKYDWEDEATTAVCVTDKNSLNKSPSDQYEVNYGDGPARAA